MRFLSVEIKNLFCFRRAKIDLTTLGGLVLVAPRTEESNGAGKTTISSKALLWTLFGQTSLGTRGDNVINRFARDGEEAWAAVELEAQGSHYKVVRSRKPKGLTVYKDGQQLETRLQEEAQELTDMIIGRNLRNFLNTDFLLYDSEQQFLKLGPREQMEIVERIIEVDQLDAPVERAKERLGEQETLHQEQKEKLTFTKGTAQAVENEIVAEKVRYGKWEQTRAMQVQACVKRIGTSDFEAKREALQAKIAEFPNDLADQVMNFSNAIRQDETRLNELRQRHTNYAERLINVRRQIQLNVVALQSHLQRKCPTCSQPINVSDAEAKAAVLNEENSILQNELDDLVAYVVDLEPQIAALQAQLKASDETYSNLTAAYRKQVDLQNQLAMLEKANEDVARAILKKQEWEESVNPFGGTLEEKAKERNRLGDEIHGLGNAINKTVEQIEHLKFWIGLLSRDFRYYLLERCCPYLQERANQHLSGLDNAHIKVRFDVRKELKSGDTKPQFHVEVESERGGYGLENLSGGERQIASFAVGLALSDLANCYVRSHSNLLVLDEPFVALDEPNCNRVVNYLLQLAKTRETILLVSNDPSLRTLVPRTLAPEECLV